MITALLFRVPSRAMLGGAAFSALLSLTGCDGRPAPVTSPVAAPTAQVAAPQPAMRSSASEARLFTTSGPLVADQQADIAAEREGRVVRILVQIGDRVQAGQVLALLDDRALHAAHDAQKAKVASLEAQVKEWEAEQQVDAADLRRADVMRREKIRSEEDWEHVKYKLDETIAEVARHRADQLAAEAELKSASIQLEQSRIVAPFSGVVGRSSVRMAQEVKKGDVLFWITAVAPLRVLFTVPESAMAQFSTGAVLELTTPVYPELHQTARVMRVSPVVDPASGSVQVIGEVTRPSPLLKPGMTMQIQPAGSAEARRKP